jgi:tetratricopeptide (TPR) repeat protein
MKLLHQFSMVETEASLPSTYVIHPVVHRWASHIQGELGEREYIGLAIMTIGLLVPDDHIRDYWVKQRQLLPHADRFLHWLKHARFTEYAFNRMAAAEGICLIGNMYNNQGLFQEAEFMYDRALRESETILGPDHTSTLTTVHNLGGLYEAQGRLQEAEKMYDRALQGYEKALGSGHLSVINTLSHLARLYEAQSRSSEAEEMYERALQAYKSAMGDDELKTCIYALDTFYNYGDFHERLGNDNKAKLCFEQAQAGYFEVYGPDHDEYKEVAERILSLTRLSSTEDGRRATGNILRRAKGLWTKTKVRIREHREK